MLTFSLKVVDQHKWMIHDFLHDYIISVYKAEIVIEKLGLKILVTHLSNGSVIHTIYHKPIAQIVNIILLLTFILFKNKKLWLIRYTKVLLVFCFQTGKKKIATSSKSSDIPHSPKNLLTERHPSITCSYGSTI